MTASLDAETAETAKTATAMLDAVRDARPNVIAVAVDGGHESRHALEWAVHHAESHGLVIRVVTAYLTPHAAIDHPMPVAILDVDAAAIARERAAAAVVDVLGEGTKLLAVEHVVTSGPIDRVLGDQVDDLAMIVVGTRRRRRWWDRFRSSATNRLTGKVDVPVMAIPCPSNCPG
jgi:nucleotide-binding universal stress UspA family protein